MRSHIISSKFLPLDSKRQGYAGASTVGSAFELSTGTSHLSPRSRLNLSRPLLSPLSPSLTHPTLSPWCRNLIHPASSPWYPRLSQIRPASSRSRSCRPWSIRIRSSMSQTRRSRPKNRWTLGHRPTWQTRERRQPRMSRSWSKSFNSPVHFNEDELPGQASFTQPWSVAHKQTRVRENGSGLAVEDSNYNVLINISYT